MTLESQKQQEGRDICPFFLSPEEEEDLEARSVLCLVEVEEQCGSQGCLDSNVYIEDCIKVEVETTDDDYSPCIVLDIVQENSQTPRWGGNHHENLKGDDLLTNMQKIFQRQASLKTEKAVGEKASDSLNNKWRKYRRAASFNSRKIVIVFSVMSSLGTLILIYLTLRKFVQVKGLRRPCPLASPKKASPSRVTQQQSSETKAAESKARSSSHFLFCHDSYPGRTACLDHKLKY